MYKENLKVGDTYTNGNYRFKIIGLDSEGRFISERIEILDADNKPSKLPEKAVKSEETIVESDEEKEPEIEEIKAPVRRASTTRRTTATRKKTATRK